MAIVDPVSLSGVTVTRASLHHPGFIKKLGLTIGAEVVMMRRGGVIPNVEYVSKPGTEPVDVPSTCPSCGSATRWEKDFLFCTSRTCKAVVIGSLSHYATAVDMLGFGDSVLEQAYDKGFLRQPADYYTLTVDQLAKLDRSGEKLAKKLVAEVDKKRTLDLATFLRALGFPELGKNVSKILSEKYRSLDDVLKVTEEEFSQVHGIGDTIARAVVQGLKDGAPIIDALRKHVTVRDFVPPAAPAAAAAGAKGSVFSGMTFVFTGKMGSLERKPAEDLVASLGGTALDAVNKALTYLVVGDLKKPGEKSSKEKAAEKHVAAGAPIKIISETDFLAMVEEAKKKAPAPAAAPATATEPEPAKAADPEPAKAADPEPAKAAEPEPAKAADPEPAKAADPEPAKVAAPEPPAAPKAKSGASAKLAGKRFAFTGSFVTFPQAEATKHVVGLGAEVADDVDASVTHLVVGSKGRAGDKLTAARKLQQGGASIEILDEKKFGALVGLGQMSLF